jgi:hypothetical protein
LPIRKPDSSKLYMSLSRNPYFSFMFYTSVNQGWISARSSQAARWRSYGRLQRVRRLGVRLMKLLTQFLPTGLLARSLNSLSAISHTSAFETRSPRTEYLSICYKITSSSSFVRRFIFSSQSRRARLPLRRSCTVVRGTL